jgi:hypothetical protein
MSQIGEIGEGMTSIVLDASRTPHTAFFGSGRGKSDGISLSGSFSDSDRLASASPRFGNPSSSNISMVHRLAMHRAHSKGLVQAFRSRQLHASLSQGSMLSEADMTNIIVDKDTVSPRYRRAALLPMDQVEDVSSRPMNMSASSYALQKQHTLSLAQRLESPRELAATLSQGSMLSEEDITRIVVDRGKGLRMVSSSETILSVPSTSGFAARLVNPSVPSHLRMNSPVAAKSNGEGSRLSATKLDQLKREEEVARSVADSLLVGDRRLPYASRGDSRAPPPPPQRSFE